MHINCLSVVAATNAYIIDMLPELTKILTFGWVRQAFLVPGIVPGATDLFFIFLTTTGIHERKNLDSNNRIPVPKLTKIQKYFEIIGKEKMLF